jgi:hypothetical protein
MEVLVFRHLLEVPERLFFGLIFGLAKVAHPQLILAVLRGLR